ncbi:MAG: hypothetical protein HRU15_08585, partial [Planctomycetes bacterium]|nr:hypothetical protein [Planctomycetota bacterium]
PRGTEEDRKSALDAMHNEQFVAASGFIDGIYGGKRGVAPKKEKHLLLWNMQMGMLQWMQHDFIHTELLLGEAARLVDERRGISVGGALGASVGNETLRAYAGEAFEHTQVDYIRMLNYLEQAQILEGLYSPAREIVKITDGGLNIGTSSPNTMDATIDAHQCYERARNIAMRLTMSQLQETVDAAGKRRYRDDGFARMMAATTVLAMPAPTNPDRQFADAMYFNMDKAFDDEQRLFVGDKHFHYEVKNPPEMAKILRARNGLRYNQNAYEKDIKKDWQENHGSILIVQHHGLTARHKTLDIRLVSGANKHGKEGQEFDVGGLAFWASGPSMSALETFSALALPEHLVSDIFGSGVTVMGFAMPVHEEDEKLDAPARVQVIDQLDNSSKYIELEVVADIDAFARATLKDEQPALFLKTFARVAAKQIAAAFAAQSAEDQQAGTGFLVKFFGSLGATLLEVADTRSWWLLPNHISASLIDVQAGNYDLELSYAGGTIDLGSVQVPAGRVVIVPVRTLQPKELIEGK